MFFVSVYCLLFKLPSNVCVCLPVQIALIRCSADDIYLRGEETGDRDTGGETDGHRHGGDAERHVITGAEVQGHEGEPDHASGVHGETCTDTATSTL